MTVRYYCPVKTCGWHHDEEDLELPTIVPWKRVPGAALATLTDRLMSAEKVVTAHLECHPRLDFVEEIGRQHVRAEMMEIRAARQRARADAADARYAALEGAVKTASDFADAVDAVHSMRMPTRVEYTTAKTAIADWLGGGDGRV